MSETPSARIVGELRRRILTGELAPGDRLPSTRQITHQWGVAMATATKVLTELRREGLVEAVPGVGTVVRRPIAAPPPPASAVAGVHDAVPAPRRRRRPGDEPLTRDRIVAAAIRIADSDGMAEVSMRKIAAELGVATMALYRYVPSKDELVELMLDRMFREMAFTPPAETIGWRAKLESVARIQWDAYRQHSWMAAELSFSRPQLIPSGMVHTEYVMAALADTGLTVVELLHAAISLLNHVRSIAIVYDEEQRNIQHTGVSADEWMKTQDGTALEVIGTGAFPMMQSAAGIPDDWFTLDSLFEFGLARYLDGLGALIASRAHPA